MSFEQTHVLTNCYLWWFYAGGLWSIRKCGVVRDHWTDDQIQVHRYLNEIRFWSCLMMMMMKYFLRLLVITIVRISHFDHHHTALVAADNNAPWSTLWHASMMMTMTEKKNHHHHHDQLCDMRQSAPTPLPTCFSQSANLLIADQLIARHYHHHFLLLAKSMWRYFF